MLVKATKLVPCARFEHFRVNGVRYKAEVEDGHDKDADLPLHVEGIDYAAENMHNFSDLCHQRRYIDMLQCVVN